MVTAVIYGEETEEQRQERERQESAAARAAMAAHSGGFDLMGESVTPPPPPAPAAVVAPAPAGAPTPATVTAATAEGTPVEELESSDKVKKIPMRSLFTDRVNFQFRQVGSGKDFSDEHVRELAENWDRSKADPILVAEMPIGSGKFVIIGGHHRHGAAQMVGEPDMDAIILGPEVGDPMTPEGQEALKERAITSNSSIRGQTLAEWVESLRGLKQLSKHYGRKDEDIIATELRALDKSKGRLIKYLSLLPDNIIEQVSTEAERGNPVYESFARELGESQEKKEMPEDKVVALWQALLSAERKNNRLPRIASWVNALKRLRVQDETGREIDMFGKAVYNFGELLNPLLDQELRDSEFKKERRILIQMKDNCVAEPRDKLGMDTSEMDGYIEVRLAYVNAMIDWLKEESAAIIKGEEPPPEPKEPVIDEALERVVTGAAAAASPRMAEELRKTQAELQVLKSLAEQRQEEINRVKAEYESAEDSKERANQTVAELMADLEKERQRVEQLERETASPEPMPEPEPTPVMALSEEEELQARVKKEMARLEPGAWLPPSVIDDIAEDLGCTVAEVDEAELFLRGDEEEPEPAVSALKGESKPVTMAALELPEPTAPPPQRDLFGMNRGIPSAIMNKPRPQKVGKTTVKASASVKRARSRAPRFNPGGARR